MDQFELDAELDRVRERVDCGRRRGIPVAVGVGVALVLVIVFLIPDAPEQHPSIAAGIVDATFSLAFLVAMVLLFVRFRRQQVSFWRQPSLVLGLERRRRRQATACGRSTLAAVRPRSARSPAAMNLSSVPLDGCLGDLHGYVGLSGAALLASAAIWSVPFYRGMRAFE